MKESSIVTNALKYLNKIPGCKARKNHGGYYGSNGEADITGCYKGRRFELELKIPGEEPRPLQVAVLAEWEAAGAVIGAAHSLDEIKKFMEGLIENVAMDRKCNLEHENPGGIRD